MTTDRPRVAAHRHLHWTATGPDYLAPCPAHLWTVTAGGRQSMAPTWLAAMDLANTLARAARPVEVKP
jgi:hypothetical protein